MEHYSELIDSIKSALELQDFSDNYDEHKYHRLENKLMETIKEIVGDETLSKQDRDRLFKMAAMVLGWYITSKEDLDRYSPEINELLSKNLINQEEARFFFENINLEE